MSEMTDKVCVVTGGGGSLGKESAKAQEIANMVLFLASDQSTFSTGGVFMADGGMSI